MRNFYAQYLEDELWLIKETVWKKALQNIRESQFAQGNGYLGTRGALEEIPYDAMPGTYIAGVYDKMAAQVAELVNLPNAFNFRFTVKGEKLDLAAMDNLEHKRALNLKNGLLIRRTIFQNSKKARFGYSSLRFVSMHDKNIGVMQIAITPLDESCEMDIHTGIDTSVANSGVITEGRKRHFRIKELGQFQNAGYLIAQTLEKKHNIAYWAGFYYESRGKKTFAKDNVFRMKLKKKQTVVFTKVFYIGHFPGNDNLSRYKEQAFKRFSRAFHAKFDILLKNHIRAWDKLWKKADILIEGTANLQQNLRFNIYHMLICAHTDAGFSSIGARTLSGEGYRGHIFWDTEIFLLPFYLFNFPPVAKNMLLYRYKRLDMARQRAKSGGFAGAQFAWESADSGAEETPEWAKDIDASIVKIHTHKLEHHITADVSYGFYKYYLATGDEKFMEKAGFEVLFETARFWASRIRKNKKRFHIDNVIGPDEFHIRVNNNAYTNMLAKWNLITAYKLFNKMKQRPTLATARLQKKLGLSAKEANSWKRLAARLAVNINKRKVIEQFDGYFKLKKVLLAQTDENGIPILSRRLKTKDLNKTQLIKQGDVLMLLYLLSDVYSLRTKKANYEFYINRTLHKSSLSPSIHSLIACECADMQKAYNLFNASLRIDISNLYNNTKEGIHAAGLGGTWQAVVFGFAGVNTKKDRLWINPRMPRTWEKIVFSLCWKGDLLRLELTNESVSLKALSKKAKKIEVGVFDNLNFIKPNKLYNFKRRKPARMPEYHY